MSESNTPERTTDLPTSMLWPATDDKSAYVAKLWLEAGRRRREAARLSGIVSATLSEAARIEALAKELNSIVSNSPHHLMQENGTRPHIVGGQFQSDKYPTCPPGKVPLSVRDPMAQDLLWQYAQRRRAVDAEFSDDLEWALREAGYAG